MRPAPDPTLSSASTSRAGRLGVVRSLPVGRDDAAIVAGLRNGEVWARAALFDRYGPQVERVLRRILGHDPRTDLADLVHDAFVQALASLGGLRDADALLAWMQTIAARTAYSAIRARRARRWLRFWEPTEVHDPPMDGVDPEVREAHRRTYAILESMPADERIAFVLRYIEGMELAPIASACEVSLATIKRRLVRAEQRFSRAAQRCEVLRPWLEEGGRWTT